jgi:hypothetical protein
MAADQDDPGDTPASDDAADATPASDDAADEESMPPFLRYGIFTVGVYGVAVSALSEVSSVDVGGATLVAFTVGFLVFMTTYFAAMWAGWLYLT